MPALVQKELGKAAVKLILIIEATARQACPVDTGNLRSSITPVVESWARGFVSTNVEYAPFVEYGTRHAPAQAFLASPAKDLIIAAILPHPILSCRTQLRGTELRATKDSLLVAVQLPPQLRVFLETVSAFRG